MAGHFAQTGPVLWRLVRAGPVPVHFAPAGPLLVDVARTGSLPAHFAWAGRVGAFSWAVPLVGHLAQPVLGHLIWQRRADIIRAGDLRPRDYAGCRAIIFR